MKKMYYTVDVEDVCGNVLAENLQEGFETMEEARAYCKDYNPDPDTKLVIYTWNGDECISTEDYE